MEIDEIRIYALSLPDTEECFPFGENNLVLKTKGKIFIIMRMVNYLFLFIKKKQISLCISHTVPFIKDILSRTMFGGN
jgi:predicted DNA-binding protein (MmcQ/YjbR family)